jgi:hypothetical protein
MQGKDIPRGKKKGLKKQGEEGKGASYDKKMH